MLNMSGSDAFPPQWNPFTDLSSTTTSCSSSDGILQSPYASLRMAAAYPATPHSGNNRDLVYGHAHVLAPGGVGGYHYGIQSPAVIGAYGVATNSNRATGHQFSIVESFNSTNPSFEGIQIDYTNKHI